MRFLLLVCVMCSVALTSGCLPLVAAGAGAVAVVRENTDQDVIYNGSIDAVEKAVRKAMKDLGCSVKEVVRKEGKKGTVVTIRGRTSDGEHLTIDLEPSSPHSVLVDVRVGVIGTRSRAQEVHAAIRKYLKPVTAAK